ncbi:MULTISPECIES: aminotransferase class V-fold PLP-dependent enzyme [unclassified Microbacterium]|uniref:kynureninase n=1 Tax=unclassified Microbacterium TaxID=2609290 RepID=UPI00214B31DD|nr:MULTISPECIES: aminotransferase class V-fold PLP-dependent enzyme [unclassified Microbacterium]MCR2808162.1 aminotransferase class V-fold PLP-dependent enzyme [Microbacterium sp. zg.B185]WIM19372.1 aminotransferase class V-fold PLP-dependent enzyme [Microbacterium sp. zg-B185]
MSTADRARTPDPGTAVPLTAEAAALDASDPLAAVRDEFVGADTSLVYFDGNSLGRPLRRTASRVDLFIREQWGGRLIRGWDESWMALPFQIGDAVGRAVIGAAAGQTVVADSTTVLLYKLIRAAFDAQRTADPARVEIVVDTDNFPTDRYLVEGIAAERGGRVRWIDVDRSSGVTAEHLRGAVGPGTAVVVLSHVAYRSGYLADAAALTRIAHDAGALILWDLCHSAGSAPVRADDWEFDLAVGCTYKYLNGGPGSPAFAYVAARHQAALAQPIQGWMGAADVFAMGPEYVPAEGMRRFVSGTPPIVGMLALQDTVAILEEVGIDAIRAKSTALTEFAIRAADDLLGPFGVTLASPRVTERRGGHITLQHPSMRAVTARLWQHDVIPDYRGPGGLRLGLSPLSTSFTETLRGMQAVRDAVDAESAVRPS